MAADRQDGAASSTRRSSSAGPDTTEGVFATIRQGAVASPPAGTLPSSVLSRDGVPAKVFHHRARLATLGLEVNVYPSRLMEFEARTALASYMPAGVISSSATTRCAITTPPVRSILNASGLPVASWLYRASTFRPSRG